MAYWQPGDLEDAVSDGRDYQRERGAAKERARDREIEETPRKVHYRETSAITYTGAMLWRLSKAEVKNCRRLGLTGKTWIASMRDAWVTYRVGVEAREAYWEEVCR